MEVPRLKSTKIAIVGGSSGRDMVSRCHNTDWNVWCIARIYNYVLFADYVFEVHDPAKWCPATYKASTQNKLILLQHYPSLPNAFVLPKDELTSTYGVVFTSSFSWLLAYAVYRGATEIAMYGVNMSHSSEQGDQRDGLFYMIGIARASGVRITLPAHSKLNQEVLFR
jgi:hypothetical protein